MRSDITDFTRRLSAIDGSEIGLIVAVATDLRRGIQRRLGWDLLDPLALIAMHPTASYDLVKLTQEFQKNGQQHLAAGMMVWVHTVRAAGEIDLRQCGRDLWRQLERGFRHAEASAEGYYDLTGAALDTSGCNLFPLGMTPDPE